MTTARTSRDVRREQIIRAALRIIAKRGMAGLTTSALAGEVGISEANLYRHFDSKDAIIAATVEQVGRDLRMNIENVLKISAEDSPLMKLKRIFMVHLDYIVKNEGIPRLVFSDEIHLGDAGMKDTLLKSIAAYAREVESIISAGQRAGLIKKVDPKATSLTFIGMIQVTILRWSLSGFAFPLVNEGLKLWENFRRCIES